MRIVLDESDDHAVEVEEEHDEVEPELDKGFLFVDVQLAEDLGGIKEVSILDNLLYVPGE